tara:strand:- start:183 stop:395 length:213 start_codon:yes stop_codon:yes gene_type:complete
VRRTPRPEEKSHGNIIVVPTAVRKRTSWKIEKSSDKKRTQAELTAYAMDEQNINRMPFKAELVVKFDIKT